MNQEQKTKAAVGIILAVAEAIRELGEVPSGELYAHLMGKLSHEEYEQVLGALLRTGLVTRTNGHLLRWTGPEVRA